MEGKSRIRQDVLRKRDSLDPDIRKAKDSLIKEQLFSLAEFQQAPVLFFFSSFRSEVSTSAQIAEALSLGKRVILPSVDSLNKELRLYEIKQLSELSAGYMGIPEPAVAEERERDINDVTLVIMPGAAFDPKGNRLGYGGGYYDRLLSRLRRRIPLVALAYEEQLVDSLPTGPHDIRVHMIVTDQRVIHCRKD
ncbi:MAG TPA: 5-formyltetrahydrofolate cyclo-ligase [Thermodesulfovibrionales bacterium]|nr:5-formyltetrahydrofolate cyclo-ligase [Thermodesulfovibrionales bacterium]